MGLDANLSDILRFSLLGPLKDKKTLKYLAFLFVFALVVGLMTNYITYTSFKPIVDNPSLVQDFSGVVGLLVQFFSFVGIIIVFSAVVNYVMQYLLMSRALEISGRSAQPATPKNIIRFIILGIAQSLCALFSVFNLKMLWIGIIGVVLVLAGFFLIGIAALNSATLFMLGCGALFLLLGIILLLVYLAIIIHNTIRLIVSDVALIGNGLSMADSLRFSWNKTTGNALNIFVIGLVLCVILVIINGILSAPSGMYSFFAQLVGNNTISLAMDPAYLVLLVPSYLSSAFMIAASAFYLVSIYLHLLTEKKTTSVSITAPKNFATPVASKPKRVAIKKTKKRAKKKRM